MHTGWIIALPSDREQLESFGITLGEYDAEKSQFLNCKVSDESLEKLDGLWGKFFWSLDEIDTNELMAASSILPSVVELADRFLECGVESRDDALWIAGHVTLLATLHAKFGEILSVQGQLSDDQVEIRDELRSEIKHFIKKFASGVSDIEFSNDPRTFSTEFKLSSGRFNNMNGTWGVAIDESLFQTLDAATPFWESHMWIPEREVALSKEVEDKPILTPLENHALATVLKQWPADLSYQAVLDAVCNADDLEDIGVELEADFNHLTGGAIVSRIESAYEDGKYLLKGHGVNIQEKEQSAFMVLTIDNTDNAAFVDVGRKLEVSRILKEQANDIAADDFLKDYSLHLRDVNGNAVGSFKYSVEKPSDPVPEGGLRLVIEGISNGTVENGNEGPEAGQILLNVAERIENGEMSFSLKEGNLKAEFAWVPTPSLDKDGVVDMAAALKSGEVYMADGIEDGEFRYVVTTNDFEIGYHQESGDVWLVNAKGEKAPGYEEPQNVREVLIRDLKRDERAQLADVIEGRLSFEDLERQFDGDEPELG